MIGPPHLPGVARAGAPIMASLFVNPTPVFQSVANPVPGSYDTTSTANCVAPTSLTHDKAASPNAVIMARFIY